MNHVLSYGKLLMLSIVILYSCSSDDETIEEEGPVQITVTTSDLNLTIDENPQNGDLIGTVTATTNQGEVSFSIISQTPSGSFQIDASSGELRVLNSENFDFILSGRIK